jgi:hypothetical protein
LLLLCNPITRGCFSAFTSVMERVGKYRYEVVLGRHLQILHHSCGDWWDCWLCPGTLSLSHSLTQCKEGDGQNFLATRRGDELACILALFHWTWHLHHEYKPAFLATATQRPSNHSAVMPCPLPHVSWRPAQMMYSTCELFTLPCDSRMPSHAGRAPLLTTCTHLCLHGR